MQDATADRKGRTAETTKEDVEGTHSTIMEKTSLPALKPEFGKRYFKTTILIVHLYMYAAQRRPCKGYAACRLGAWYTAPQRLYKQRHSTERGIAYYGRK
jgi:hypothetical protein